MTDAHLMDADCIHGIAWYDCKECGQGPTGIELTPDEVVVVQDAVAAELARYLMYWSDDCQGSFDALTEAGRKLGMEL